MGDGNGALGSNTPSLRFADEVGNAAREDSIWVSSTSTSVEGGAHRDGRPLPMAHPAMLQLQLSALLALPQPILVVRQSEVTVYLCNVAAARLWGAGADTSAVQGRHVRTLMEHANGRAGDAFLTVWQHDGISGGFDATLLNEESSRVRVDCLPVATDLPSSSSSEGLGDHHPQREGHGAKFMCLFISLTESSRKDSAPGDKAGQHGCPHGRKAGAAEARPHFDAFALSSTSTHIDGFAQAPTGGGCVFAGALSEAKPSTVQAASAASGMQDIENAKLRVLLDQTAEGFIICDENGYIQSFNKAATEMFQYTAEEAIGMKINSFMPRRTARHHDEYLKSFKSENVGRLVLGQSRNVQGLRKDGTKFPIVLSVSVAEFNGEHLFAATVRDISNELLLMNMLPPSIADRLRMKEVPINDKHEGVGVLFADIVGFTTMSSNLTALEVVTFLNDIFHVFDELAETYNLEKIKTIGDCYMVVSGIPHRDDDHLVKLACFALEMQHALKVYNEEAQLKYPLDMRVGIHCGTVIAGVVGKSKFMYDIWGDTVNVASRMESSGVPGQIQTSEAFQKEVNDFFRFSDRGMVHVKGKGELHTYMLEGIRKTEAYNLKAKLAQAAVQRGSIDISRFDLALPPRRSLSDNKDEGLGPALANRRMSTGTSSRAIIFGPYLQNAIQEAIIMGDASDDDDSVTEYSLPIPGTVEVEATSKPSARAVWTENPTDTIKAGHHEGKGNPHSPTELLIHKSFMSDKAKPKSSHSLETHSNAVKGLMCCGKQSGKCCIM